MNENPLRQEMDRLAAELMADPSIAPKVRAFLHLWAAWSLIESDRSDAPTSIPVLPPLRNGATANFPKTGRQMSPARQQILVTVRDFIRGASHPVKTSTIFDALPDDLRGEIRGVDQKSSLSAMLSNSPWFRSHRRSGWMLADEPDPRAVFDLDGPELEALAHPP